MLTRPVLAMVLFASAACAQTAPPTAKDLGPPFSILGNVRLGMSTTELEAERPGVEGKPEYGYTERIEGRKVVYFFKGEYGDLMSFRTSGLAAVFVTEELPKGPIPADRFEAFRARGDAPITCETVKQTGVLVFKKAVGESEFMISVIPMIVNRNRRGDVDSMPRRLSVGWQSTVNPIVPDQVAVACPLVGRDLPP